MAKKQETHLWLKESGLDRALNEHHRLGCVYPGILTLVTLGSLLLVLRHGWWWMPALPAILAVISHYLARPYLHRKMVCPRCGFNPTLRKSDGEPRQDYHKVLAQLERYEACPNCGVTEEEGSNASSDQDIDDLGEVGDDQVG